MAAYRPCRVAFALLLMLAIGRAHATSVLMISVDGMKPEYAL